MFTRDLRRTIAIFPEENIPRGFFFIIDILELLNEIVEPVQCHIQVESTLHKFLGQVHISSGYRYRIHCLQTLKLPDR